MEARRTPRSAAPWSAAYSARLSPHSFLSLQYSAYCTECASPASTRRARKRRIPMQEINPPRRVAGRVSLLIGLMAAVALAFFIYSGIHSRVEAESGLQHVTEVAAIED